jgi:thymidylate synthase ThyX
MVLDETARARVASYVTSVEDDVFALFGLPEEVIAVLFAYYSRSRDDLRTNLAKLLADQELDVASGAAPKLALASEKARAFHEKWVVGYGHASVAEHAVVHLALENVSIVASKVIEDLRLGSYTEKSTRYVVFDTGSFVDLPELPEPLRSRYRASGERLFSTYLELMPKVTAELERVLGPGASPAAVRAQACDLLRGLLPAGTRTNLGLTANARALEGLLVKMMSSPLAEVRRIAEEMHRAAGHVAPTLLKYAAPSEYRRSLGARVEGALRTVYTPPTNERSTMVMGQPVRLVRWDKDALLRISLALGFEGSGPAVHTAGLADALAYAQRAELEAIVTASVDGRGKYDGMPRAFEATSMTFELLLDYGAYRDLQRHRMLTPATQRLTARLGFDVPPELEDMGFRDVYQEAMLSAYDVWATLERQGFPAEAQYAVPLGYRLRTLWTLDLRELVHVIELRSAKQGHVSYRRIAQALHRLAVGVHPWLKDLVRVDTNDYPLARG